MSEPWRADELEGFERRTLALAPEEDGELVATLVRRRRELAAPAPRGAALYLHGYVDYFFHVHLADAYRAAGFDLWALDLRRAGRSLRPGNVPHQFRHVDEYFTEIDSAIELITDSQLPLAGLVGHSTGGLIAAHYAARGRERRALRCLILNSPFFDFRAAPAEKAALPFVAAWGRLFPHAPAPVSLNPVYGQSLHAEHSGEWHFDRHKKPHGGFGVTCGWIAAISSAHALLRRGLNVACPVLVQHSSSSRRGGRALVERDHYADLVLDVEHMKRFAGCVGARVELQEITGGRHDLTLSREPARSEAIRGQLAFLERFA